MKVLSLTLMLAVGVSTIPGAVLATTSCDVSTACEAVTNTYSASASGGVAIHGAANSGIGVRGTSASNTGFYGASSSGAVETPGVEGESTATSHKSDSAGAFGIAASLVGTAPAYGVSGYGIINGVYGESDSPGSSNASFGYAVEGNDPSGSTNSFNVGVVGNSHVGTGIFGVSNGYATLGLMGDVPIGVYAVSEPTGSGTNQAVGLEAESTSFPIEARNSGTKATVDIAANADYLHGVGGSGSFTITSAGSEMLSGTLTTSKGTYVATRGASGAVRTAYGARTTTPEIEDVGEAQLVNGRASVAIDSAFADSIDMRRPYHVFVTPDGDSNQLYVAQKTPTGFVVREAHGGRSTLAFDYRIVAKPLDEADARLPAYHLAAAERTLPVRPGNRLAVVASPQERLRATLGAAGYARAVVGLRARLAGR